MQACKLASRRSFCLSPFLFILTFLLIISPQMCLGDLVLSGGGSGTKSVWNVDDISHGYSFTTSTSLRVTDLGILDLDSDGLNEDHKVGLWDISGILLAEVTVSAGTSDPLINGFRFAGLASPINVGPGTYWLGAHYQTQISDVSSADLWRRLDSVELSTLTPSWATIESRGVVLGYDNPANGSVVSDGGANVGPNLMATAIPEPAMLTPLLPILGLLSIRRQKRTGCVAQSKNLN